MRWCLLFGMLAACKDTPPTPADPPVAAPILPAETLCQPLPFAESTPLPEASAATWMTIDGALALVAVSDSGNKGAYAILDPDTGATRAQGFLPLGNAGEDNEGAATRGDRLVALTSSGYIREWTYKDKAFVLVRDAYPIGAVDAACGPKNTNCGADYEGLCLANKPAGDCIGFALSRKRGTLTCLVDKDGTLALGDRVIPISDPKKLADCAFSDDDRLFVGANTFALNNVWRVENWQGDAKLVDLGGLGPGFAETIAARGDTLYRMSDAGGAPSLMARFRCPRT